MEYIYRNILETGFYIKLLSRVLPNDNLTRKSYSLSVKFSLRTSRKLCGDTGILLPCCTFGDSSQMSFLSLTPDQRSLKHVSKTLRHSKVRLYFLYVFTSCPPFRLLMPVSTPILPCERPPFYSTKRFVSKI